MISSDFISTIYTTLFFVLSAAMFVVKIPQQEEYDFYRKTRYTMATAFIILGLIGLIESKAIDLYGNEYVDFCIFSLIGLIFTALNYLGFFYISETAHIHFKNVAKIIGLGGITVTVLGLAGCLFWDKNLYFRLAISLTHVLTAVILLYISVREYNKCKEQVDNYYSNHMWDLKWMIVMLWVTFGLTFILIMSFWFHSIEHYLDFLMMIFYSYLAFKILSFVPSTIDKVRHKISKAETEEEELLIENENKPSSTKLNEYSRKIVPLIELWVASEHYIRPTLTIREVAQEMGTNYNYLSTYINNELNMTFTTWLNTLRVEKSKEYLCSAEKISIEECGIKVGIPEIYNYSRWFKVVTGMSPASFRKSMCENVR